MSHNRLRPTIPVNRRLKPPHKLHRQVVVRRSSNKNSKSINRCNSEPALTSFTAGSVAGDDHRNMTPPGDSCLLFRNRIVTDVFSSSPELLPNSPEKNEGYNKEAKVAIKVTVEGSVGPIRTLVKLGSSVDDTIKLVMNKYNAERRSPQLDQDDMTSFELHHSNFSLQSFDKSNRIGDINSRSFYMRKSSVKNMSFNTSNGSEIVVADEAEEAPYTCSNIFFTNFIHEGLRKMIKRMSRIGRLFGCFGG